MIRMKVSAQHARRELSRIDHKTCQRGVKNYWHTYKDGSGMEQATAQSIAWLSRWAATGMGSLRACKQAAQAFDSIFDQPHDWLLARLPIPDAERLRYKKPKRMDARIEQDFADCLKRNSSGKRNP